MESKLFTPVTFGPLTLRNRTIRSAAFESMCPGNAPSQMLLDYHRSVAAGGVGMTTVAYAAVTQSGLSFDRQLWLRPEIISGLREVTGAIHTEGAAAGIQIGHCGNMSHKRLRNHSHFSFYRFQSLFSYIRAWHEERRVAGDGQSLRTGCPLGTGSRLRRRRGTRRTRISDQPVPVSLHQSPERRLRRLAPKPDALYGMVMNEVMTAAGSDMAVIVKMNMRDGFKGGMETDESLQVAKRLLALGAHALVLSGGFVSKAPMYVMRGAMPIRSMAYYMDCWWLKYGVRMFGKWMIPTVPFREAYFLEDALKFRAALPEAPLIYVGGLVSRER